VSPRIDRDLCGRCWGMESMSGSPHPLKGVRWAVKMGGDFLVNGMIHDGLWCPFGNVHMGMTTENIASKHGISREAQGKGQGPIVLRNFGGSFELGGGYYPG